AAAVAKLKPEPKSKRREISDAGCPGLHLVIQPSGVKSWAMRFRRPDGRSAKLTLGAVDITGKEAKEAPKIGDPLTLAAARVLATDVRRQLKRGVDPAAAWVVEKQRRRVVAIEKASNTFAAAARQFLDEHKVRRSGQKPRGWRETARLLGLDYPADGEPT